MPDFDDYSELHNKITKLDKTLSLLVQCLDIPKIYKVNNIEFSCRFEAEKFAEDCRHVFKKKAVGMTGCLPTYDIEVIPYPQ